ncbi:MAG: PhzF family phenazine biosynthesis protein [Enterocloster sp.]
MDCGRRGEAGQRLVSKFECNGYWHAFTLNPQNRNFGPRKDVRPGAIGTAEDPVTGNANGPLWGHIWCILIFYRRKMPAASTFDILQGEAIKRDGINARQFMLKKSTERRSWFKLQGML